LTVEEAALLLRISRTKAYALTRQWRATGGATGLPVVDFGDALRVPRQALERMLGVELTGPLPARPKAPGRVPVSAHEAGPAPGGPGHSHVAPELLAGTPAANVTPIRRPGRRPGSDQAALFESPPTSADR
jgi:hypothetical protein